MKINFKTIKKILGSTSCFEYQLLKKFLGIQEIVSIHSLF